MTELLVVLALLSAVVGIFTTSQATAGVGSIAFACLMAILARIAQSADQHKKVIAAILSTKTDV